MRVWLDLVQRIVWLLLPLVVVVSGEQAKADDLSRSTILEENDSLPFNSDKHYTQGLRLSYLAPDLKAGSDWETPFGVFDILGGAAPTSRRYSLELGQSIFTPKNSHLDPPDPKDRPYAGWLYAGVNLLQDTNSRYLDHLGLQLGVVGPGAFGKQVQNNFHQLIGVGQFEGWSHQLQNEPGLVLDYERSWHLWLLGDHETGNGIDVVPEAGATIGNVFDYGEAGAMLRIGKNLDTDYGPVRIRPALSGTDYFDADQAHGHWGGYFFLGTQGRVVGRNIFLDGNSFRTSASIPKKTLVGDLEAGLSVYDITGFRVDVSGMRRSVEYIGQRAPDVLGVVAITWVW